MKQTQIAYSIFGVLFIAFLFLSYSGSAPNGYTGAPGDGTCAGCHSGNFLNMDGDIQIVGVPASIVSNSTYPITVIVSNPDGISLTAGFSMVVLDSNGSNAGTLSNASAGSSISAGGIRDYFRHNPAQPYDANRNAIWTVDWTAPSAPSNELITFYGIGNITDNNPGVNTSSDFVVSSSASGSINSTPQNPDLTLTNLGGWTGVFAPGEVVFFDFDLNNIGNITASGDYNISAYLSTDTTWDPNDFFGGDLTTGNTGVGTINGVVGAITVPLNLPPGNYYLILVVDTFSEIAESNENNNTLVSGTSSPVQTSTPIVLTVSSTDATCFGMFDGTATATASGGNGPYSYSWSNSMMTPTISNLGAGTYLVTITDANGVMTNDMVAVNEPSELIFNISNVIGVQCASDATGSASPFISGGTIPYNIMWPGGSNVNLTAGTYTATVTDGNNCSTMTTYEIQANDTTNPIAVLNQLTVLTLDSNGQGNVPSAAIYDDNSTDNCGGPLTFSAQTNFTCADLGMMTINVDVTDDAGNTTTVSHTVEVQDLIPPTISCAMDITLLNCDGVVDYTLPTVVDNCDSNIVPTLTAGLPSGSQFPVGTTQVTYEAVDASGNAISCSFNVEVAQGMTTMIDTTAPECFGGSNGSATVTPNGGAPPYLYMWSNNETTQTISDIPAGNYTVTVTEANGCEVVSIFSIAEPTELLLSIDMIQNDDGGQNGSIFITASGGQPGYTYNWTNASGVIVSTLEDPQNFSEGLYTITVFDANGCMVTSLPIQILTIVGVSEIELAKEINIYPNPTSGQLNVEINSHRSRDMELEVFDQFGKLVYNNKITDSQNNVLNLTNLEAGLYWFKFIVENEFVVKKVVVAF